MGNYWDELMTDDEGASTYMLTYGEGPGSPLRHFIGSLINDGESVLDVGCGPGWNFDHFQEYGPTFSNYRGYDYSERFVRVANQRVMDKPMMYLQTEDVSEVQPPMFRLGDVRDIKESDKSWDVVILQDVLEHTNGYEKPVHEALRVARKRVIITFWRLTTETDTDTINDDGNDGYGAAYSRSKWEKFLDSLDLHWLHDEIPRKGQIHNIYVIDKEAKHGN